MAHLVYPGAGHDRLEHSRGVVEAAERMIRALERNAAHRRSFGRDRDESGLPLGIDLTRLISKLEVVVVTPETAPNQELRERAEQSPGKRFYELGISQAGLGSYEQLIIARVLLYDRLYYHHKVRAAEAMLQQLIRLAEEERGAKYSISDLFSAISDDIFVSVTGGELQSLVLQCGGERSRRFAEALREAPRALSGIRVRCSLHCRPRRTSRQRPERHPGTQVAQASAGTIDRSGLPYHCGNNSSKGD